MFETRRRAVYTLVKNGKENIFYTQKDVIDFLEITRNDFNKVYYNKHVKKKF